MTDIVQAKPYRHNRLSEVITKIDFVTPVRELENDLPRELVKQIRERFPIAVVCLILCKKA